MDERSENDKMEEIMHLGFRFHPTDEEIVGFYLKRKVQVQHQPLSMELIKQLDIYEYDPWDLPSEFTYIAVFIALMELETNSVSFFFFNEELASTSEKEWYFYCPRQSSQRVETDWMMHEFRLASLADSVPPKRFLDKTIPANDSWAICRIFKKTNSTAQRVLSNSWVSPTPETSSVSDVPDIPLTGAFSTLDYVPYKPITHMSNGDLTSVITSLNHASSASKSAVGVTYMSSSMLGDHYCKSSNSLHFGGGFSGTTLPHEMQGNNMMSNVSHGDDDQWDHAVRSIAIGFPFSLPLPMNIMGVGRCLEVKRGLGFFMS
ncbi:hypothetical protein V6N12_005879 [Hibiscus sabdariffa]|uniref:NAC domain-containing protein n=1 Tax=Hibiscus sabdariffa TaxID=183260 RepID=A0ABR2EWS1_9ROSI